MDHLDKKVAKLFMQEGFLKDCFCAGQHLLPHKLAERCLKDSEYINIYLNWSNTTQKLSRHGVEVEREWFSEFCQGGNIHGRRFFTLVFTHMLFKPKALKEYL